MEEERIGLFIDYENLAIGARDDLGIEFDFKPIADALAERGRVVVRPGAQKTDARQSNPNLLLSDRAMIDTKPQLEIYADDVKASHGSTIGQLDAEAVFFLRARGIGEAEARLVLTRGFAHSIVEGIANESVRESVAEQVEGALATLGTSNEDTAR